MERDDGDTCRDLTGHRAQSLAAVPLVGGTTVAAALLSTGRLASRSDTEAGIDKEIMAVTLALTRS